MKKILIGCAVVAVILVVVVVAAIALFANWAEKQGAEYEQWSKLRQQLEEHLGTQEAYVPALDGTLSGERVAAFVRVREEIQEAREQPAAAIDELLSRSQTDTRGVIERIQKAIDTVRSGVQVGRVAASYLNLSTNKLLEAEMGEGEYLYLYALLAYSWLDWDPVEAFGDQGSSDVDEAIDGVWNKNRRLAIQHLQNQLRVLEEKPDKTPAENDALRRVEAALERARSERKFPYSGAMPADWVATLEPYRERFTPTLPKTPGEYLIDCATMLEDDEGGFQFGFGKH